MKTMSATTLAMMLAVTMMTHDAFARAGGGGHPGGGAHAMGGAPHGGGHDFGSRGGRGDFGGFRGDGGRFRHGFRGFGCELQYDGYYPPYCYRRGYGY